jgi:hypothetical protein
VRLSRCDVRDHINGRKNYRCPSYGFYRALQRWKSPCATFARFSEPDVFEFFNTIGQEQTCPLWRCAMIRQIAGSRETSRCGVFVESLTSLASVDEACDRAAGDQSTPRWAALELIFFKTSQMLQRGICHAGVA